MTHLDIILVSEYAISTKIIEIIHKTAIVTSTRSNGAIFLLAEEVVFIYLIFGVCLIATILSGTIEQLVKNCIILVILPTQGNFQLLQLCILKD